MRKIKLMHLVWSLSTGGMERGVVKVCNGLPSDEFAPAICTFFSGGVEERSVEENVQLRHRQRFGGYDVTLPLRLARLFRREQVDIVHTHNWATFREGLAAAKLARVPVLVHGEHGHVRDRRRQVLAQRWGWRHVDRVLSVSAALADRVAAAIRFPREQIQVIPNGVELARFRPRHQGTAEVRRELGLPADSPVIGMVARFVPFKNHAGVLEALAELRDRSPLPHLALAGDGELRGDLEQLAARLRISDQVHFLGELGHVEDFLPALDIFVSNSSYNEGMSNAVLEAMACAVPCISTRIAAGPELLDNGRAGLLVEPEGPQGLAAALRQLLYDPQLQAQLGAIGRQRVEQHYSVEVMVESYRQLYLQLMGHGTAAGHNSRKRQRKLRGREPISALPNDALGGRR